MKKIFSLLCCTFLSAATLQAVLPNQRSILLKEQDNSHTIRVRVLHEVPKVELGVTGSYLLMDPYNKNDVHNRIYGKSATLQPMANGLKWGEEFPDMHQIKVLPTTPKTEILLNGKPYLGLLTFYEIGDSRTLSVVNDLNIEDYVANLLMRSLTGTEPQEAINALAIAARSTAYYQVQHPRNRQFWDVDGITVGYLGPIDFAPAPAVITAVSKALRDTRYMLLTDPAGSLNDAFYAPWSVEQAQDKTGLLTLKAATEAADKGQHAAQILHATFPTAILQRTPPAPST